MVADSFGGAAVTGLSLRAAEIEHDRRESEVDEDEAAEFWAAHDRYMAGYYEARAPRPGALMVPPEEWEEESDGRST